MGYWCIVIMGKGGNLGLVVLCLVGVGEEEVVLLFYVGYSIRDGMLKGFFIYFGIWNFLLKN